LLIPGFLVFDASFSFDCFYFGHLCCFNYPEWSQKIKQTLIFNELWKGVCVGDGDKELEQPTTDKEFSIWENKNSKGYALIAASVNE